MEYVGQRVTGIVADAEDVDDYPTPFARCRRPHLLHSRVDLIARVPHGHEDARHERDDDRNHGALEVNAVAHMRRPLRDATGRI